MRDRITAIIAILLLAGLAGASYWYSHAARFQLVSVPVSREGPDFVVDQVTMTQFDIAGRAKHKLFAESLSHYPTDDRVDATRPRLVSLRADEPQVEARAQRARVEGSGEKVILIGDVVVTRAGVGDEPPMRMKTERLVAFPDEERFTTDELAELERGGSRVSSIGMDYDNLKRVVKLRNRVRGTVEPQTSAKGLK